MLAFFSAQKQRQNKKKNWEKRKAFAPPTRSQNKGHLISWQLYAASVFRSHALGFAKRRACAMFCTLFRAGYSCHCSDWTRATRMLVEVLNITSLNRKFMQFSNPIYEPHSNIVAIGLWQHCDPCYYVIRFLRRNDHKKYSVFILEIIPRHRSFLVSGIACKCTWVPNNARDLA